MAFTGVDRAAGRRNQISTSRLLHMVGCDGEKATRRQRWGRMVLPNANYRPLTHTTARPTNSSNTELSTRTRIGRAVDLSRHSVPLVSHNSSPYRLHMWGSNHQGTIKLHAQVYTGRQTSSPLQSLQVFRDGLLDFACAGTRCLCKLDKCCLCTRCAHQITC